MKTEPIGSIQDGEIVAAVIGVGEPPRRLMRPETRPVPQAAVRDTAPAVVRTLLPDAVRRAVRVAGAALPAPLHRIMSGAMNGPRRRGDDVVLETVRSTPQPS